jgi:hypothetical protein
MSLDTLQCHQVAGQKEAACVDHIEKEAINIPLDPEKPNLGAGSIICVEETGPLRTTWGENRIDYSSTSENLA